MKDAWLCVDCNAELPEPDRYKDSEQNIDWYIQDECHACLSNNGFHNHKRYEEEE